MTKPRTLSPRNSNLSLFTLLDFLAEAWDNGKSYKILDLGQNIGDDTQDFIIGKDEYFFLGDNRDNSLDSRFDRQFGGVGLVPKEYLIGKASLILFSSSGSSIFYFWSWRKDRFFKVIS